MATTDDGRGKYGAVPVEEEEHRGKTAGRSSMSTYESRESIDEDGNVKRVIKRTRGMTDADRKRGRAVKFPDTWAFHLADMPYIPLTSYIVTIIAQHYANIRVQDSVEDFQDMSGTDNYEEVITYCAVLAYVTYGLNATIMIFEFLLTHYFRDWMCRLACSNIVQLPWMNRDKAYVFVSSFSAFFMLTYYSILLFVGVISVFAFVVWILVDVIAAMCSTLGDAATFVNLLSLTNSAFDQYFRAGYFCSDRDAISTDVKWVTIWYFVLFFAQLNLLGIVAQQRYRMHLGLHNLHVEHTDAREDEEEQDEFEHEGEEDDLGTWM